MLLYHEEKEKEYQEKAKRFQGLKNRYSIKARDTLMSKFRKNEDFSEQKFSGSFLGENDEYLQIYKL